MIGHGHANTRDTTKDEEFSFDSGSEGEVSQYESSAKTPQLRIVDVFALLTIAALICALVVPILRVTNPDAKKIAAIVLVIQVVVTLVGAVLMFQRRSNSLKNIGARIGIGYRSEIKWKYWPEVSNILLLAFVAIATIGLSVAYGLMLNSGGGNWMMFSFNILQFGWMTSTVFFHWISRAYPGRIEFYQQGIVLQGHRWLDWSKVEIKPSTLYADRIVLHVSDEKQGVLRQMLVVRVSEELRTAIWEGLKGDKV